MFHSARPFRLLCVQRADETLSACLKFAVASLAHHKPAHRMCQCKTYLETINNMLKKSCEEPKLGGEYVLHLLVANHQPTRKSTERSTPDQSRSKFCFHSTPPRCQRMHLHAIHCSRNVDHNRSPSNTSRIKCWPTPAMLHSRPATGGPLLRPCFIKTAL